MLKVETIQVLMDALKLTKFDYSQGMGIEVSIWTEEELKQIKAALFTQLKSM